MPRNHLLAEETLILLNTLSLALAVLPVLQKVFLPLLVCKAMRSCGLNSTGYGFWQVMVTSSPGGLLSLCHSSTEGGGGRRRRRSVDLFTVCAELGGQSPPARNV